MTKRMKPKARGERLPNAPLAEAVFELRWALQGDEEAPSALKADPGFAALVANFNGAARRMGFPAHRDMSPMHATGGWGVFRRYYVEQDKGFPLLQIGPGIFAANQSSEYEWRSFKKFILGGIRKLLEAYPRINGLPLTPVHIELRYVDVFEKALIGTTDFLDFARKATNVTISVPDFLDSRTSFGVPADGRVQVSVPVKRKRETIFFFDYAAAQRGSERIIQLQSKVISRGKGVPINRGARSFVTAVADWLDDAHDLTSPFFKAFIKPHILEKFE